MRVIAIDGPAGAGKSTVSRAIARQLGYAHLDTGAMYRAVTLAVLRRGLDPKAGPAVAAVARDVDLEIAERVLLDGEDVSDAIRGPDVTASVSDVAANPDVRTEMVQRQRAWVTTHEPAVVEGRDIGSVVFPAAALKVFLTANDDVRALRRRDEQAAHGGTAEVAAVAADIARRDRLDSTRDASPLRVPGDALVIDTSSRSVADVVDEILQHL